VPTISTHDINWYSQRRGLGEVKRAHHSLAERPPNIPHITSPIRRKQTSFDVTVKAAMRPIGYARNVSVLHRIEMNIVDMAFKVPVIANSVFSISTLPDAFFSFCNLAGRSCLRWIKTSRKATLD
jgi:hypothetical protein